MKIERQEKDKIKCNKIQSKIGNCRTEWNNEENKRIMKIETNIKTDKKYIKE